LQKSKEADLGLLVDEPLDLIFFETCKKIVFLDGDRMDGRSG